MRLVLFLMLSVACVPAFAQCPAGIPSAGNPGCIPPDQSNSPYYQQNGGASSGPREEWAHRWGAIAMDTSRNSVGIGVAEMMSSERKAKTTALQDCRSKGGKQCELQLTYHDQCGVLVWAAVGHNTMRAGTVEEAEKMALDKCAQDGLKDCKVYYSSCSYPERLR